MIDSVFKFNLNFTNKKISNFKIKIKTVFAIVSFWVLKQTLMQKLYWKQVSCHQIVEAYNINNLDHLRRVKHQIF